MIRKILQKKITIDEDIFWIIWMQYGVIFIAVLFVSRMPPFFHLGFIYMAFALFTWINTKV